VKTRVTFILTLLVCALGVHAQNIVITDGHGEGVYQAVVAVKQPNATKPDFAITDVNGGVDILIRSTPAFITVSHVSYKTHYDTLFQTTDNMTIALKLADVALPEVIITNEYTPRTQDQIVHATRIISNETINSRAANSLDELLEQEAGIRITQDNILGSGMSMNGLSGQNIKFLVDGVPVVGRLNGDIDISQLLLSDVERIEIINGPMSAMYGTDAAGGVINIISKPAAVSKTNGGVNFYHESSGHNNVDGYAGNRWNKSSIKVSGGRNYFGGWSTADTGRTDEWKPKEQIFGSINYAYTAKKFSIGFKSDILHETVTNLGETKITPYYAYAFDEYYKTIRLNNRLNASYMLGPYRGINISVARSDYKRTKNTWRKDMVSLEDELIPDANMHDTTIFNTWNVRGVISKQEDNQVLNYQAGIDIALEKAKGPRFINDTESIRDYAAFASAEYKPHEKLVIKPAVRIAYNSNYNAPVVPSLSVLYNISKPFQVRFSYGKGFRSPGIKELYLYFVDVNHNIQGNEDLKPENSQNFYMAVDHSLNINKLTIKTNVGGFYNDISDMIALAQPNLSNSLYTYVNIGKYSTHGFNFNTEVRIKQLSAGIGMSYTGRYNIYADSGDHKTYSYNPDLTLNFGYHVKKIGLSANVNFKYNGKLPGYTLTADNSVTQFYNDSYSIMDLIVRKSLFKGIMTVGGGIKNVFDVTNISTVNDGGVHSGSSNSLAVGTGRSLFFNLKIALSGK
jgi:outer membrane receptor for ferrienterochelin and colicins